MEPTTQMEPTANIQSINEQKKIRAEIIKNYEILRKYDNHWYIPSKPINIHALIKPLEMFDHYIECGDETDSYEFLFMCNSFLKRANEIIIILKEQREEREEKCCCLFFS